MIPDAPIMNFTTVFWLSIKYDTVFNVKFFDKQLKTTFFISYEHSFYLCAKIY